MYFEHGFQDISGSCDITHTPACHSIGFRETIQQHCAFLHTWQSDNTHVLWSINNTTVYFVYVYNQIMLNGELSDPFEFRAWDNSSSGIIWVTKQDHLGSWRNCSRDFSGLHSKVICGIGWNGHRYATG